MKKIKFYACPQCGNVVWSTGEAELSCCGRKLAALEVQKADNTINSAKRKCFNPRICKRCDWYTSRLFQI